MTKTIHFIFTLFLVFSLCGCEAFVRKFTRKPKKDKIPKEEIIISPEEYHKEELPLEEKYRKYFLFWKSWHDELIDALISRGNHKKQIDCIKETISSLSNLRNLLDETRQRELDKYISQLNRLKEEIEKDIYATKANFYRLKAENLKRNILRDFSYSKIKQR